MKKKTRLCYSIRKGLKVSGLRSCGDIVEVLIDKSDELIRARRVILALPKSPLQELSWNGTDAPKNCTTR